MTERCRHCGEPALDTDIVCWHCGLPLAGREKLKSTKVKVKEGWQQSVSPEAVAIYAGITVIVILATFLVMSILGQQPRVQVRFGEKRPINWNEITSADKTFIVTLPENWQLLDGENEIQRPTLDALISENQLFHLATYPFGAEVDDVRISFLAESQPTTTEQQPAFLVVALSELLNRLTYEEAINFLLSSEYQISEARFVDNFDRSHVSILVRTDVSEGDTVTIRCRQQFIHGESETMLVSLCATATRYPAYSTIFEDILGSFQRLGA